MSGHALFFGDIWSARPKRCGMHPYPTTPDGINPEWLEKALGHGIKTLIRTQSILNATASKLFFTIEYSEESTAPRPKHICVKGGFNPAMMADQGLKNLLASAYKTEARFFSLVAEKLNFISIPKVWWSGWEEEQGIIIMDDLALQGYEFGNPVHAWSVEMVMLGVEQLAGLHASTWGYTTEKYPWMKPSYEGMIMGLTELWYNQVHGEDRPPLPAIIKDSRVRTVSALKKHFRTKNPDFRCVIHGDPHTGNTYIDGDGNPKFLDWQTFHIGSPFHDLTYFIVGALSVADRKRHEIPIIDHYLHYLWKFGGPKLEINDPIVFKEYRKSMMSGMGWILTPYDLQPKERVFAMCERYAAAIVDLKTIELIESLPDPK
ncbi:putative aminoglycoside phosphotransferase protein [Fusarium flagelliforme]|uniref:Putative aminoglycoside phosphotransferase protein n=1 Tax=Fusarium flagelliforme TaxID=2675880 RepID=A0A395MRY8_9HYPO|nr:putative aminoglycoside phosphotransferase protein [Fusarium flagelliforme]